MDIAELKPISKITEREAKEIAFFLGADFKKMIPPKEGEKNIKIEVYSKRIGGYQNGYILLYFDGSLSFKYRCLVKNRKYAKKSVSIRPATLKEINRYLKTSGFKLN